MKLLSRVGTVYLVGAGPGDPDLMTVKGLRLLQKAEVLVYDRLADDRLLDLAPREAERIYAGKKGGCYAFPQEKINQLLVSRARQGKQVVRLKGGDPFLFGRGAEECLFLAQHGIPFEVVPGLCSALAVPALAGIPVTHRGCASSVTIVTGRQAEDSPRQVEWGRLAASADTLVILMPLQRLRQIVSQLVTHGRPLDTPAALIQSGGLPGQRRVSATLRNIAAESSRAGITSPALLVVGAVVELADLLKPEQAPPQPATQEIRNTLGIDS